MRVSLIHNTLDGCPPEIRKESGKNFCEFLKIIPIGTEFEVYAVMCDSICRYQIVRGGYPSWDASWFFEIIDNSIPSDWICNSFVYPTYSFPWNKIPGIKQDNILTVIGPSFIAESYQSFCETMSQEGKPIIEFWKRVKQIGLEPPPPPEDTVLQQLQKQWQKNDR